jgi:hypothetical protein
MPLHLPTINERKKRNYMESAWEWLFRSRKYTSDLQEFKEMFSTVPEAHKNYARKSGREYKATGNMTGKKLPTRVQDIL